MHPFRARARFATENSDLLTDANAYEECVGLRNKGESQSAIRAFCEQVSPKPFEAQYAG